MRPWVLIGFSLSMFSQPSSLQLIPGKKVGSGPSMLCPLCIVSKLRVVYGDGRNLA